MEETTTIPPEAIYHPLTQQEFIELREFITKLGHNLPDNKMSYVWSYFNRLQGTNIPQPCGCQSAAGHWVNAINYIKGWVNERV